MKHRYVLTIVAAGTAAALALSPAAPAAHGPKASARAAHGPKISIRIEGQRRTLLKAETIATRTGSFRRDGQKVARNTELGALNSATHSHWRGTWYPTYNEWFVTSILGDTPSSKAKLSWSVYVNGVYSSTGVGAKVKAGEKLLFAVTSYAGATPLVSNLVAPKTAKVGKAFTVKFQDYTAKGKLVPLKGVTVTTTFVSKHRGVTGVSTGSGSQRTFRYKRAGTLTVTISKHGYVRDEATIKVAG